MYVILPNNKTAGLGKVIDGFSAEILRKSISTMTDQFIQLELPKFHFESTLFLAPVLKKVLSVLFSKNNFKYIIVRIM